MTGDGVCRQSHVLACIVIPGHKNKFVGLTFVAGPDAIVENGNIGTPLQVDTVNTDNTITALYARVISWRTRLHVGHPQLSRRARADHGPGDAVTDGLAGLSQGV